jgi:hypothetical protein
MRIRTLLTLLAFLPACFLLPAAADSTGGSTPAAACSRIDFTEACLANAKGMQLAQIQTACCKDPKASAAAARRARPCAATTPPARSRGVRVMRRRRS